MSRGHRFPRSLLAWGLALALLLVAAGVLAQSGGSFELSWSSVDGGGASSTGDPYQLDGAGGQPDSGEELSGAPFSLTGGFYRFREEYPTAIVLRRFFTTGTAWSWAPLATAALALIAVLLVYHRRRSC